jgi:hypothetical protein
VIENLNIYPMGISRATLLSMLELKVKKRKEKKNKLTVNGGMGLTLYYSGRDPFCKESKEMTAVRSRV